MYNGEFVLNSINDGKHVIMDEKQDVKEDFKNVTTKFENILF
jgi:hypothetical protein